MNWGRRGTEHERKKTHRAIVFGQDCSTDLEKQEKFAKMALRIGSKYQNVCELGKKRPSNILPCCFLGHFQVSSLVLYEDIHGQALMDPPQRKTKIQ